MPKPTFEQLPAAKRQRIIDIAIAEFAEHPYAVASVSRIVAQAGIAKGSIYQYFEHKQDLYLFLLDYAMQSQLQLLRELAPPDPELGFFALLRWQMSASVRVGLAMPQLVRLLYRATAGDLPFHDEVIRRLRSTGEEHLFQLLQQAAKRGEIDPALDLELAAFMIKSLTSELSALIARRQGLSDQQAAADIAQLSGPEVELIYDAVLRMLQYGLAASRPITHESTL
jgi:AcrR family transcriptional regulator